MNEDKQEINDLIIPILIFAESSIWAAYLFLQMDDFDKGKTDSRLLNQKRWWVSLDFFLNFPIKRCIIFATMLKYLDGQESSKELANLETFSY